jgi:hypothetical protein
MLETNENATLEVSPPLTARERKRILERDQWRCRYCGSQRDLQVDHIFPRSLGGGNQDENLAVACATCNHEKSNKVGMMPRPVERNRFEGMKHWKRLALFLMLFQAFWFCLGVGMRAFCVIFFWGLLYLLLHVESGLAIWISFWWVALIDLIVIFQLNRTKDKGEFPTLEMLIQVIGR